jgi:hypothetical protein
VKRNVADYMRKMKDIFEVEAKYPRHDSSLGPIRQSRSFPTTKLSCVRVLEQNSRNTLLVDDSTEHTEKLKKVLQRKHQPRIYSNTELQGNLCKGVLALQNVCGFEPRSFQTMFKSGSLSAPSKFHPLLLSA